MVARLVDNRNPDSLAAKLRRKRFALFLALLESVERPVSILDVGGTESFWQVMGFDSEKDVAVTLLNVYPQTAASGNFATVCGDARAMQFGDKSFDVVFSNSVIEHVGGISDQKRMVQEVERVGRRYFIQTPNRNFPIEPHFLFPFFQFLPLTTRTWLLQHFNLGWHKKTPEFAEARAQVAGVELLTRHQFQAMFTDATIVEERLGGLVKSFVAYGGWKPENLDRGTTTTVSTPLR